MRAQGSSIVDKGHCRAKRVGHQRSCPRSVGAGEIFIEPEAREQVRRSGRAGLAHRLEPVVEELCALSVDLLAPSASEGVVGEGRRHPAGDLHQPVAGVPGVGVHPVARQVPVGVVREGPAAEGPLAVGRVVGGHVQPVRQQRPRKRAADS